MRERSNFYADAKVTLSDGSSIHLTKDDFVASGNKVTDGSGVNGLPLGVAVQRIVQLEIFNDNERFSGVDFQGAEIALKLKFDLSQGTESVDFGVFTVLGPATYGETVNITAVDAMYKADKPFSSGATFPVSASSLFVEACAKADLAFASAVFPNSDFVISEPPEGRTCREVIGYVAMIAGGNARIDRYGKVAIVPWKFLESTERTSISGGTFTDWENENSLSGGTFLDASSENEISGGSFSPWTVGYGADFEQGQHVFDDWNELRTDMNDIIITGIQTAVDKTDADGSSYTQTIQIGEDGYVLSIENPLILGVEETALDLIAADIVGARFRKFDGEYRAYPLAEFMDTVTLYDRHGNTYASVITDIEFVFLGAAYFSNSAESALAVNSSFTTPESRAIIAARKLVATERSERETAIGRLEQNLANASGLYTTDVMQEDGSTVRYLHDKPTLDASSVVIVITSAGIGVSNDGGKTYPYGITVDGETIMRIISAEGISADWIRSGALTITDDEGNVIFSVDKDTKTFTSAAIDSVSAAVNSNKYEADDRLDALQALANGNATDIQAANNNAQESAKNTKDSIDELERRVMAQISSNAADINVVQKQLSDGAVKVITTSGAFDENGLTIGSSEAPTKTNIDEDGVEVTNGDEVVLVADSAGVNALNLTARQYLTIGLNSRFEDYKGSRTACFYIGG
ncbi:MAG: hypothetical protein J6R01_08140 [Alistipes sp.]|nr:hypothetical protein [Alistipes sp.]